MNMGGNNVNMQKMQSLGLALAIVWAVYKFGRHDAVKAAALGVGGVIVAKQLPYVKDVM